MNINCEIGLKIERVETDKHFVRPSEFFWDKDYRLMTDLILHEGEGKRVYICGSNDWAFLALDLTEPIKEEAKRILKGIQERKEQYPKLKAIELGKNDKRILDVFYGGRDKCKMIYGLPVIESDDINKVGYLVEDNFELPF